MLPACLLTPCVRALGLHLATARYEDTPTSQIDVIKGDLRPKFIDQEQLNDEILHEMMPLFEEWSGVKLKPAIAYGLRVYQNNSALLMHTDKIEVLSVICLADCDCIAHRNKL